MKKVILALAVVSVTFAACNNGENKDTPKTDSTVKKMDSTVTKMDSTVKKIDSLVKKVDTATKK